MGSSSPTFIPVKPIINFRQNEICKKSSAVILIVGASAQSQYRPGGSAGGFGGSTGGFGGGSGFGGGFDEGASDFGAGGGGASDLEENIPGVPGDDYPIYAEVPDTSFLCDGQAEGGYYADPEAECQVFHICGSDGNGGLTKYSFLCPNGTLFNQQYFVCDWWFNVDCSLAEQFYALNDQIAAERDANSPAGAAGGYDSGAGAAAGAGAGGRSGAGGRGAGGRRGGSQASASSPRGSYSAPDNYGSGSAGFGDSSFDSADSGYGAPAGGDFGGSAGGSLSGYGGRRRNARDLDLSDAAELSIENNEEYEY